MAVTAICLASLAVLTAIATRHYTQRAMADRQKAAQIYQQLAATRRTSRRW